jgi:hypothetical protein
MSKSFSLLLLFVVFLQISQSVSVIDVEDDMDWDSSRQYGMGSHCGTRQTHPHDMMERSGKHSGNFGSNSRFNQPTWGNWWPSWSDSDWFPRWNTHSTRRGSLQSLPFSSRASLLDRSQNNKVLWVPLVDIKEVGYTPFQP